MGENWKKRKNKKGKEREKTQIPTAEFLITWRWCQLLVLSTFCRNWARSCITVSIFGRLQHCPDWWSLTFWTCRSISNWFIIPARDETKQNKTRIFLWKWRLLQGHVPRITDKNLLIHCRHELRAFYISMITEETPKKNLYVETTLHYHVIKREIKGSKGQADEWY